MGEPPQAQPPYAGLGHSLGLYWRLLGIRVRAQMQYRSAFIADVAIAAVLAVVGFITLAQVLLKFDNIGGWRLWELALLYGLLEAAFGSMDMLFSGFDPPFFGQLVRLGSFDQMLLRPAPVLVQVLGADLVMRRLGRVLQGLVVLGLALYNLPIAWTAERALLLPLVYISLVAFFGGLFVTGATITFWTVDSIELMNVLTYGGSEMMAYPMYIYPAWLQRFFTYILPAVFLIYAPAVYILDKPDPLHLPAWSALLSPLVGFGVLLFGLAFFNYGLRHYQSTGT